jgi:hypothetical protein
MLIAKMHLLPIFSLFFLISRTCSAEIIIHEPLFKILPGTIQTKIKQLSPNEPNFHQQCAAKILENMEKYDFCTPEAVSLFVNLLCDFETTVIKTQDNSKKDLESIFAIFVGLYAREQKLAATILETKLAELQELIENMVLEYFANQGRTIAATLVIEMSRAINEACSFRHRYYYRGLVQTRFSPLWVRNKVENILPLLAQEEIRSQHLERDEADFQKYLATILNDHIASITDSVIFGFYWWTDATFAAFADPAKSNPMWGKMLEELWLARQYSKKATLALFLKIANEDFSLLLGQDTQLDKKLNLLITNFAKETVTAIYPEPELEIRSSNSTSPKTFA